MTETKAKTLEEQVAEVIRDSYPKIPAGKLEAMVAGIVALLPGDEVREVEILGARGAAGRVELAGLEIAVDALGRATSVHFPDGAQVTEWIA